MLIDNFICKIIRRHLFYDEIHTDKLLEPMRCNNAIKNAKNTKNHYYSSRLKVDRFTIFK